MKIFMKEREKKRVIMLMMMAYPGIHEDEIHLHKCKNHLQERINSTKYLMAGRSKRRFEKYSKFETVVNHRAQAKS